MSRKVAPKPNHPWDQAVIDSAVKFTALVFRGRGKYIREGGVCSYATLEAAEAGGERLASLHGKPAMIYGVNAKGFSAHIKNINPPK